MLKNVPGMMYETIRWFISRKTIAVSGVVIGLGAWGTSIRPAAAISLNLVPAKQEVVVSEALSLDISIVALGDFSAPSLSTFDFDLGFEPSVLSFTGLTFGDPLLGDQVDRSGTARLFTEQGIFDAIGFSEASPGVVNFFEESFDLPQDLDTLQPGAFTLATLDFVALGNGNSDLTETINALGDSQGNPLTIDAIEIPSVTIVSTPGKSVPEPMTSWFGLLSFVAMGSWGIKKTDIVQCWQGERLFCRKRRC